MIDRDRLVKTFCDLVTIDSPSGEEEEVATALTERLEALEFNVARDSYGNLIANDGGDDPIILSAHMDTVEPGRGVKPIVDGDRIASDETTIVGGDCKAGIAAILESLTSIKESGASRQAVEVVMTREEEPGLIGARHLDFSMIKGKEAIVFDGEGPASRITSASPTYTGFVIDVKGLSAHAGMEPEKGVSAIRIAAELITKLPQGRLDPETTFNVGLIEGGQVRNAVPETTRITGEFRAVESDTHEGVRRQLEKALEETRTAHPEATIEHSMKTEFEAYRLTDDDPATRRIKAAIESLGMEPTMRTSGGGTDGNVFRLNGISAVVVGMAVTGMHTRQEWVSIPGLVDTARLCETLLMQ